MSTLDTHSTATQHGPATTTTASSAAPKSVLADVIERFGLLGLFVGVIVIFSALMPEIFPTSANFRSIAISGSVLAVVAMALILPLVTGRFDISVGANVGLCSIAVAGAMSQFGANPIVAMLISVTLGSLIGLINGLLVSFLGINSIITTLGTSTVVAGIVQAYTGGIPISAGLSPALTGLSNQLFLGLPVLFVIMLVIGAAVLVLLEHSTLGRYFAAVGSNEKAASLTGLPTRRIVLASFVGAGFLAGVAGILQIASQGNGNPQVGGIGFMLPALAAVFLGATAIRPGTYNLIGAIIGLFFVGTTISGLSLIGVQPWITDVFNGVAVIVAVGLSALFRRRRTGVAVMGS